MNSTIKPLVDKHVDMASSTFEPLEEERMETDTIQKDLINLDDTLPCQL